MKEKFYRTTILLVILHGIECWVVKKQYIYRMSVTEIRMLGWISKNKWKDRIWNVKIRLKIGVASINEKMRKSQLRWFDHVQRRATNMPIRNSELIYVKGTERKVEETKKSH